VSLGEPQIRRYARHILLADVGGIGQRRLLEASVAVPDASGPSGPALLYLAAAGIGTLVVEDEGLVETSDVGWIYLPSDVGRTRREALSDRLSGLNPDVAVRDAGQAGHWLSRTAASGVIDALASGSAMAGELVRQIARGRA
jgi:adenylyltransferase/sulfurtransferase